MKVSVVVATYKREEPLKRALESLAKQSFSDFEIVLVDDNAQEAWNAKVQSIVEEFYRANPLITLNYIKNEVNLGSAKTRNKGIATAQGKYITFLDDDDIYLENKIQKQVAFMEENNLDYSVTDLDLYFDNGKLSEHKKRDFIKSTDSESLFRYHLMYHITGTDTMMFTKEYLEKIGGFAPIDVGDEFYLMQRAIENGGRFGYLPECDVVAFVHTEEDGLSSGDNKIKGENLLFAHKKQYFKQLKAKDRRYIRMRHHAVLAFAYLRKKRFFMFFVEAVASFLVTPIACLELFFTIIKKK